MKNSALVIGGGIAGIQAALDLAENGVRVYLVEKGPSIGGRMSQLDKTFPTLDCSMCIESPKMSEVGRNPRIKMLTNAEVEGVEGRAGDFVVTVWQKNTLVTDECTGCGDCAEACPITVPNEFDMGLKTRKAIYVPFPQAVPSKYVVDSAACLNRPNLFVCNKCGEVCQRHCIKIDMKPETVYRLEVGAIIVATGINVLDPTVLKEYGYGVLPDVMTALEFERMLSATGPTEGSLVRISNGERPKKLVFIQCVGSRDQRFREYCSRVCCTYSMKEALLAKDHEKDLDITILYMDVRAYGKGFERFYERVQGEGIKFLRGRPSRVFESGNRLIVHVEDTEEGKLKDLEADLVVLAPAVVPSEDVAQLATALKVEVDKDGFFKEKNGTLQPMDSTKEGIFLCGTSTGPRDISESVSQASGCVSRALRFLERTADKRRELPVSEVREEPRIGVFVCRCGTNIARVIDVPALVKQSKRMPDVVHSAEMLFACSDSAQKEIAKAIAEHGLNRVVVAACSPITHEPIFMKVCEDAGLNPYLLEMANIRNHDSWVHSDGTAATKKAVGLIRAGVAKARHLRPLKRKSYGVNQKALVVGGGLTGMAAALALSEIGIKTVLVEKKGELGGRLRELYRLAPEGLDPKEVVSSMAAALGNSGVTVRLNDSVEKVSGFVGNFQATLASGEALEVGTIIIATGTELYVPKEFGYGNDPRVITNLELERRMPEVGEERVTFISCTGSRNQERGCSRYCCQTTIHQAIELREMGKKVRVLYKDVRTFGKGAEELYKKALEKGVLFVRYRKDPEYKNGTVRVFDELSRRHVNIPTDLLVLATGMVPVEGLGNMLRLAKSEDGFLMELHPKLGPVETMAKGIFLAGTVQGPKDLKDSLSQAYAAAAKASAVLSRGTLDIDPIVASSDELLCASCGCCTSVCDYGAVELKEMNGRTVAVVNEAVCRGCGACVASCPSGAMEIAGYTTEQIGAMIGALFDYDETKLPKGGLA